MRPRTLLLIGMLAVVALAVPRSAVAQAYSGRSDNPNGPTVSPYLNLLQNNPLSPVTNYQSLVKPLINQGNAIQRQGNSLSRLQQQMYSGAAGGGMGTGHRSFFMNYSHYYPMAGQP